MPSILARKLLQLYQRSVVFDQYACSGNEDVTLVTRERLFTVNRYVQILYEAGSSCCAILVVYE